jgi:hypothetical protein
MNGKFLNGAMPIVDAPRADPLVELLEKALADAKAGRTIAVGLVTVHAPNQWQVFMVGPGASEVHIGCGVLQDHAKRLSTTPKTSPIVRASALPGGG